MSAHTYANFRAVVERMIRAGLVKPPPPSEVRWDGPGNHKPGYRRDWMRRWRAAKRGT